MSLKLMLIAAPVALFAANTFAAPINLAPLVGFGGADGWLSPADYAFLTATGTNNRGMAYNAATGNVIVTSTGAAGDPRIKVLSGATGAEVGALTTTGVGGGAVTLGSFRADSAGVLYATNVSTNASTTGVKLYRWANESAAPSVAASATIATAGRYGDNLDLIGTGVNTRLVSGFSNSPNVNPAGYVLYTTADGTTFTASTVSVAPAPAAGDFRLGITFTDSDSVVGTQGASVNVRHTNTDGTLTNSFKLTSASERGMDYTEITINGPGGPMTIKLLATVDTATSLTRVYNASAIDSSTTTLPLLASLDLTGAGAVAANNGLSALSWGAATLIDNGFGASINLYVLNPNDGISAFTLTVPEPTSLAAIGGFAMLAGRRRK